MFPIEQAIGEEASVAQQRTPPSLRIHGGARTTRGAIRQFAQVQIALAASDVAGDFATTWSAATKTRGYTTPQS